MNLQISTIIFIDRPESKHSLTYESLQNTSQFLPNQLQFPYEKHMKIYNIIQYIIHIKEEKNSYIEQDF